MNAKKIATLIIVPFMMSIFLLDILTVARCNRYCAAYPVSAESFDGTGGDDRIHFLNVANSDCMLLESNGHFALVDSGEGDRNPRRKTEYEGYEDEVLSYLKKVAADESGKVQLDFILGTHYHYDHVGNFHAIITDESIEIGRAYFKKYDALVDKSYETEAWGLPGIYAQIISDLDARGIETVQSLPEQPFEFGDFTLQLFNTVNSEEIAGEGENAASIGMLIKKAGRTVFLASDITGTTGTEDVVGKAVGDVDVLKIGHHGYFGSSSRSFLKELKPEIAIVTNQLGKIYPNVKWNLTMYAHAAIFATYDNDGLIVSITDSGEILMTNKIA